MSHPLFAAVATLADTTLPTTHPVARPAVPFAALATATVGFLAVAAAVAAAAVAIASVAQPAAAVTVAAVAYFGSAQLSAAAAAANAWRLRSGPPSAPGIRRSLRWGASGLRRSWRWLRLAPEEEVLLYDDKERGSPHDRELLGGGQRPSLPPPLAWPSRANSM